MNKKIGRPKTPKNEAKTELWGAFLNPLESKHVAIEVKEQDKSKSDFIRERLLSGLPPEDDIFWDEKLPYPEEELSDKRIEYKLWIQWVNTNKLSITTGTGTLKIRRRPNQFHVQIIARHPFNRESTLDLTSQQAALIKKQKADSEYDFIISEIQC